MWGRLHQKTEGQGAKYLIKVEEQIQWEILRTENKGDCCQEMRCYTEGNNGGSEAALSQGLRVPQWREGRKSLQSWGRQELVKLRTQILKGIIFHSCDVWPEWQWNSVGKGHWYSRCQIIWWMWSSHKNVNRCQRQKIRKTSFSGKRQGCSEGFICSKSAIGR